MVKSELRRRKSLHVTLTIFGVAIAVFLAWAWIGFGSISPALSYLSGERLLIDAHRRSFGPLPVGENRTVEFMLDNRTRHSIKVLGCNSPCTCVMAENLPMILDPDARHSIKITVRSRPDRLGAVSETLRLFTDEPKRSVIVLNVFGQFTPNPSAPKSAATGG